MAQIPRITQGDRPSSVFTPAVDNSAAGIIGAMGDMTGEFLETATAEEQNERKRLALALEEKQKIVDSSNAGRVTLEFEDTHFKTLDDLETEYVNNPEAIPEQYTKRMREHANSVLKREDINDAVKLEATKSVESTMSSGLRQAYGLTSKLQTEQVKSNLAKARIVFSGAAIGRSSPQDVKNLADKFTAQEMPNFKAAYGNAAEEEMQKSVSEAYYAWAKDFSHLHPGEYRAFDLQLIKDNIPQHYTELNEGANSSLKGITRRQLNDTYIGAVRSGVQITKAYAAGQLDVPSILTKRKEWNAKIDAISIDPNLTAEQRTEQITPITRELGVLRIIEDMMRTELKAEQIPEDELPAEITTERNALFGKDKKGQVRAKSLNDLLEYKKNLVLAVSKKNINPGNYSSLIKEVDLSMEKSVSKERRNTWAWFEDTPKQIGNARLEERFEEEKPGASVQERNRATLKFIDAFNTAVESGKSPTEVEAKKMAEDAFNISYGVAPAETRTK